MFKSALTLTREELERITIYVRERIEAIEESRRDGWIAERERFEREWNDDFSHRGGGVFTKSNESLNMVGSGIDFIRSRVVEEIFGSKPWFSADPRPRSGCDPVFSDQVRRHLAWKLGPNQINFEGIASDLVTQACKLGECVTKVFYENREETFERVMPVLWDDEARAPVLTPAGEPIVSEAQAAHYRGAQEGEWRPGETERLRPGLSWREQIVTQRRTHYSGARAVPLHFREFYCPLHAPSIHDADFVAHMTSMRLSELCAHLGVTMEEVEKGSADDAVFHAIRQIRTAHPPNEAAALLPGEAEETPVAEGDPAFRLAEAYFELDVRGDGRPCRIFMMVAYDFDLPIYWDYIANVTPTGRYPFEAVVINKEPHRWYGRSWFKKYEKFQQLIDKLLNQILYRNELAANPVKFRRKEAVVQWQDDQPLEIGPDMIFDLNDGYNASDALQSARIPELDEQTKYLLEMVISSWRTRSGVTTATQGVFGGLPSERTATGITQIVQSGLTIFRPQVMDIRRGLEALLRQIVDYQYACQAADETFSYLEGDTRVEGVLCRERLDDLQFSVELTLSRARQLQRLEAAGVAVDFFEKFLKVPDDYKAVAAPLFTMVYKNLEIDNAEDYFRRVVDTMGEGGGE